MNINRMNEMPQDIDPVIIRRLDVYLENQKEFRDVIKRKNKELIMYYKNNHTLPLYLFELNGKNIIYGFDLVNEIVMYYMEYEIDSSLFNEPAITQVMVWRSPIAGNKISGIAYYVIKNFIFKRWRILITDKQQSAQGKRLWLDMLSKIFEDFKVYRINRDSGDILELGSYKELLEAESQIWGNNKKFQNEAIGIII